MTKRKTGLFRHAFSLYFFLGVLVYDHHLLADEQDIHLHSLLRSYSSLVTAVFTLSYRSCILKTGSGSYDVDFNEGSHALNRIRNRYTVNMNIGDVLDLEPAQADALDEMETQLNLIADIFNENQHSLNIQKLLFLTFMRDIPSFEIASGWKKDDLGKRIKRNWRRVIDASYDAEAIFATPDEKLNLYSRKPWVEIFNEVNRKLKSVYALEGIDCSKVCGMWSDILQAKAVRRQSPSPGEK